MPPFRAEIARIEKLLPSAPDKVTVTYQMARTWASAKQWPETMEWLRKAIDFKAGLDPSRDSVFADLRDTREFGDILAAVREGTPAVSTSRAAFVVNEGDLVPESVAYDASSESFYFGSMKKGKVVRCSRSGNCTQFAIVRPWRRPRAQSTKRRALAPEQLGRRFGVDSLRPCIRARDSQLSRPR